MILKTVFLSLLLVSITTGAQSQQSPYIYVLGVAQDAGYPQAGCFQAHCMKGWEDPKKRLGAASLAVIVPDARKTYLFEATPHLPEQLYLLNQKVPDYKLQGIFLTHAHIGHYSGLMYLGKEVMGASQMAVYAMPRMGKFLEQNGPWSQLVKLNNIVIKPLQHNQSVALHSMRFTPFLVPHRDEYSETVGYRIQSKTKSAVFIPDINKWQDWQTSLSQLAENHDYVLIDATFYADGELGERDMSKIPHPFVTESMALLEKLSDRNKSHVWFIHMNHTNPLLDLDSPESKQVKSKGFNIAYQGLTLSM